jgi:DNA-binding beta-propeller fold protein YncE
VPDGYLLFAIDFVNGQPKHVATSKSAAIPVLSNRNTGAACGSSPVETLGSFGGGKLKCFRPTGVAFDGKGKLYMASDATNEIYVIGREDGSSVDDLQAVEPTVR